MLGYRCSECGRTVGLMADIHCAPTLYKCPRTGRVAQLQRPPRMPAQADGEKIKHRRNRKQRKERE